MLNLIIFIICALAAVYWAIVGNVDKVLLEVALALLNLPGIMMWMHDN